MLKRIFDIVVSSLMLFLLLPVFMFVALNIIITIGRPIFFTQKRPGQNGQLFRMIKFRTMSQECDSDGVLLPDQLRMTAVGRFLRALSLDELPELWNVLKGDMSLVGPRPLLEEYLPLYSDEQQRRHHVRPGITGWAQVNGRNAISWNEKFALDVWYVDNQSFWLDFKILFLTVFKVLKRDGITSEGHVSAEKFTGNAN